MSRLMAGTKNKPGHDQADSANKDPQLHMKQWWTNATEDELHEVRGTHECPADGEQQRADQKARDGNSATPHSPTLVFAFRVVLYDRRLVCARQRINGGLPSTTFAKQILRLLRSHQDD